MALEKVLASAASYAVQGAQTTLDALTKTTPGALAVDLFATSYFMSSIAQSGVCSKETATNTAAFVLLTLAFKTLGGSTPVTGKLLLATLSQTALKIVDGKMFAWAFTANQDQMRNEHYDFRDIKWTTSSLKPVFPKSQFDMFDVNEDCKPASLHGWGFQYKGAFKILAGLAYFGLRGADIYMVAKNGQNLFTLLRENAPQFLKSLPGISRYI